MQATEPYAKTIVFCEDSDHAERMHQVLVNALLALAGANRRYLVRITGDNDEGKAQRGTPWENPARRTIRL